MYNGNICSMLNLNFSCSTYLLRLSSTALKIRNPSVLYKNKLNRNPLHKVFKMLNWSYADRVNFIKSKILINMFMFLVYLELRFIYRVVHGGDLSEVF